jgi:two-component system, LytTR family, response regulator
MIHTILIDDEPIALKHLTAIISKNCPQLNIKATASSVEEGIELIKQMRPDLVFLDIELSGHNSFELLQQIPNLSFEKIFVTAYDQFGIQAIKYGASDYILKPIDKAEFIEAVEKVATKIYAKRVEANRHHSIDQATPHSNRLSLPTIDGLIFIDIPKIMYCESEGRYTRFYVAESNKKILVSKNIGEYEALLPPQNFVRIHSHYIVNLAYVERYVKGRGGYVVLTDGKMLEVSARKKDDFLSKLEG